MLRNLRQMIERQILKAQAEGKLQGLEGEGKPLPDRSGEAYLDAGEAVGVRMMAEAGALPEEFKLKGELEQARKEWQATSDVDEKKRLMSKIADLELRYSIATEARKKFMK